MDEFTPNDEAMQKANFERFDAERNKLDGLRTYIRHAISDLDEAQLLRIARLVMDIKYPPE